nr:MAG TPA: hypothetical protein [Caudoviricetes sp.]
MDNIIIEISKDCNNSFTVRQGDKFCDKLTYDEMLGTISALTMPKERPCVHWLRTEEQWTAYYANVLTARNKLIKNEV